MQYAAAAVAVEINIATNVEFQNGQVSHQMANNHDKQAVVAAAANAYLVLFCITNYFFIIMHQQIECGK